MKKKLFDIESDEVKRILSLHEERTKNQYLNIVSEQTTPVANYTTTQWNKFDGGDFGLPKGTKFVATGDPLVVRSPKAIAYVNYNGNWSKQEKAVSFYCKQGKFYIQGYEKEPLVNATLASALVKNVCGKVNFKPTTAAKGKTYTQSKNQNFISEKGANGTIPANTVWSWNGKEAVGKTKGVDKPTMFSCTPYNSKYGFNFKFDGNIFKNDGGELLNMLKKSFCLVQDNTQPKQELPVKDANAGKVTDVKVDGNKNTGTQKQFTQDVTNLNTQIQTSLGIQTPTGQLTDTDIDAILAKLG